jgi:hypothetical protein
MGNKFQVLLAGTRPALPSSSGVRSGFTRPVRYRPHTHIAHIARTTRHTLRTTRHTTARAPPHTTRAHTAADGSGDWGVAGVRRWEWALFHGLSWGIPLVCVVGLVSGDLLTQSPNLYLCFPKKPWHIILWYDTRRTTQHDTTQHDTHIGCACRVTCLRVRVCVRRRFAPVLASFGLNLLFYLVTNFYFSSLILAIHYLFLRYYFTKI